MTLPYSLTHPAVALLVDFTFYPGTLTDPTMRLWLDGTRLDVPPEVAALCRELPGWGTYYPDKQLRLVLVQLVAKGYTEFFTPSAPAPPALPYEGLSKAA